MHIFEQQRELRDKLVHEQQDDIYGVHRKDQGDEGVASFPLSMIQVPIGGGSQRLGNAAHHIVEKSEGHGSSFVGHQTL